jgi:hypothetical protein
MPDTKPLTTEEIKQIKAIPMLFILGKGRSGTSLLQNLLDAHPGIIGGPESKFMVIFHPCFAHIKKWKETDIIDFVEKLYMEPLFTALWHLDKKELTKILLSAIDFADYTLLCKIVYYQMRKGKENLIYISDKNPQYIIHLKTISKLFPEAKFVHIVRDPLDNIYSEITSFRIGNVLFRACQWVGYNSIVEKRKEIEPGKYLTILYENLVSNTEGTMKLVCEYLDISFAGTMTQNQSPDWLKAHQERMGIAENERMIHRNLMKPIDTSNVGKWKNKMDPYDQMIAEVVTGSFAKKMYRYDIDSNRNNKSLKVSPFTILKGKCVYLIWQEFTRLKAKSFRFNLFYSKLKRKNRKVPIWEYF